MWEPITALLYNRTMVNQGVNVATLLKSGIVPYVNLCFAIRRLLENGKIGDGGTCGDCGRRLLAMTTDGREELTVTLAITPGQAIKDCEAKRYLERGE